MGDFVEELLVRLGIDIDRQSIDRAIRSMDGVEQGADGAGNAVEGMGRKADGAGIEFARMATVVAGAATAISGALGAMVVSFANAGNEVGNLARLANTSTDTLQRNAAAARTVGVQTEELAQIYKDMGDRVGDFLQTGGGPMADFFENIAPQVGVTAEMFRDLSGPDALQLYVSSLESANLSQSEMTFFLEAMAGDLTKLQPLLANGGAEMKRLGDEAAATGAIMDEAAIKSAADLSTEMGLASITVEGLRNSIGKELAPAVIDIIKGFREFIKENRELITLGLSRMFDAARFALKGLTVAVAVFLSYKLGLAVMAIARGVMALRAAFVAARTAALLMNAAALLIPILIGAAVVAAGLIFEDFITWINGGESAIGALIEKFPALGKVFEVLKFHFENVRDIAQALWNLLTGDWSKAGDLFMGVIARWKEALLGFFNWFGDKFDAAFGAVGEFFGISAPDAGSLGTATGGGIIGGIPASAQVAASAGVTNNSSQSSVVQNDNRTITIQGADIGEVKRVLRTDYAYAARTSASGVEY